MKRCALALASFVIFSLVSERPEARAQGIAGWQLQPGEAVVYDVDRVDPAGATTHGLYAVYGSDIDADRRTFRTVISGLEDVIFRYLFSYPTGAVRDGARWAARERFDRAGTELGGACSVEGAFRAEAQGDGRMRVVGELIITPTPGGPAGTITTARVQIAATWVEPGSIPEASYTVTLSRLDASNRPVPETRQATLVQREVLNLQAEEFLTRIDSAIARGCARLRALTDPSGLVASADQGMGRLSLCLLALLRSGVSRSDPLVTSGFDLLSGAPFQQTYSAAIYIMALEARSDVREGRVGTQVRFGRQPMAATDIRRMEEACAWLVRNREARAGVWDYNGIGEAVARVRPVGAGDHSNTQFAVLALHTAASCGVNVPPEVFGEIADHFVDVQEPSGPDTPVDVTSDGGTTGSGGQGTTVRTLAPWGARFPENARRRARGFAYDTVQAAANTATGAMSCAGLSSLIIAESWLARANQLGGRRGGRVPEAIQDAIAWVCRSFSVRVNPFTAPGINYYHLYSIEKVGELAEVARFGLHDWYLEGALELMNVQDADGGWGDYVNTSLALLFLNRATLALDVDIRENRRLATGESRAGLVYVNGIGLVDAVDSIRVLVGGDPSRANERVNTAQQVVAAMDALDRMVLVPPLVEVLNANPPPRIRTFAADTLRDITGERLRDGAAYLAWHQRWQRFTDARAYDEVRADVTPGLTSENAVVRRLVCRGLLRLRAIEAAGPLIEALDAARGLPERELLHQTLTSLTHQDRGYNPSGTRRERDDAIAAWRAWWVDSQERIVLETRMAPLLADLRSSELVRASQAADGLVALGRPAVPLLVEAMRQEGAPREDLGWVLSRITGANLGPDATAWAAWLRDHPQAP